MATENSSHRTFSYLWVMTILAIMVTNTHAISQPDDLVPVLANKASPQKIIIAQADGDKPPKQQVEEEEEPDCD